jgi:alpha-beta hydrolase superfamily lysophospholipase
MPETRPQFLEVPSGEGPRRIAYLQQPGRGDGRPGVVWLQGFKSEMTSIKASHLAQWTAARGLALTRFDYSGHGQSDGRFEDGTLGQWLKEARAVFDQVTQGPQVLVGSSMGGFVTLLLARALSPDAQRRMAGIVLIAPAWDMISELMLKRLTDEAKAAIARDGVWLRPSRYEDGPYPITRRLIDEGLGHVIKGTRLVTGCPVRILHGMEDPDVPWQHSMQLVEELGSRDVRLTLIKDGEHRLSRPQDLDLLTATIGELVAQSAQSMTITSAEGGSA